MRVLVAPDKFAGTLTAVEAAQAIADGWRRHAPDDELDLAPMADGGPGFVDVLHEALGGEVLAVTVAGPFGEPTPATVLLVGRDGVRRERPGLRTAPDPSRACRGGLDPRRRRAGPGRGRRRGPGGRRRASAAAGPPTAAPGCWRPSAPRPTVRWTRDRPVSRASPPSTSRPARARLGDVALVAASDVDNQLTGLFGAAKTFGPQKGIARRPHPRRRRLARVVRRGPRPPHRPCSRAPAPPAAWATHCWPWGRPAGRASTSWPRPRAWRSAPGPSTWCSPARAPSTSPAGAARSRTAWRPSPRRRCGRAWRWPGKVLVGSREMRALGVESAYAIVDLVGEERAFAEPAAALAELAQRVARTWSR